MNEHDKPSKTQRKKTMHSLQRLGSELVDLADKELAALGLPENLHDAIVAARHITSFEARRRQLQYIGKLMRHIDAGPIRETLEMRRLSAQRRAAFHHRVERWRERLLAEETAFAEFVSAYPHANAQRVRVLIRNVQRERDADRPPRSYRALFQLLRQILEESSKPGP
jgi:ribosome-associated protein